jgi:hypothetical protein
VQNAGPSPKPASQHPHVSQRPCSQVCIEGMCRAPAPPPSRCGSGCLSNQAWTQHDDPPGLACLAWLGMRDSTLRWSCLSSCIWCGPISSPCSALGGASYCPYCSAPNDFAFQSGRPLEFLEFPKVFEEAKTRDLMCGGSNVCSVCRALPPPPPRHPYQSALLSSTTSRHITSHHAIPRISKLHAGRQTRRGHHQRPPRTRRHRALPLPSLLLLFRLICFLLFRNVCGRSEEFSKLQKILREGHKSPQNLLER